MAYLLAEIAFEDLRSVTLGCIVTFLEAKLALEFVCPLWASIFFRMIALAAPTIPSWSWCRWVGSRHLASHVA